MKLKNYDFIPYQPYLELNSSYKSYKPEHGDSFFGLVWEVYQIDDFDIQYSMVMPDGSINLMMVITSSEKYCYLFSSVKEKKDLRKMPAFNDIKSVFGIRFSSGSVGNLINIAELKEDFVEAEKVISGFGKTSEKLKAADSFDERWEIVSGFLEKNTKDSYKVDNISCEVVNYICRNKGNVSVKELEEHTGYSGKWLNEKLYSNIGVTVKELNQVVKFQYSYYFYTRNKDEMKMNYAQLAVICGYYDQSHMNRVYKKITGYKARDILNLYTMPQQRAV